ncbi:MAG: RNA methyltransferase [Solirubrobacteraceae bacterium]
MTAITSQHNPRLKELRKLHRRRDRDRAGLFVAEGEDLIVAAAAAGRTAVHGYRAPGTAVGGTEFEEVEPGLLAGVSTLGSGTRAIGVYEQRFGKLAGPLCVCLWGVGDPGNVGTVLRGALAFGAACVALGPGCADPHSPKAVRASMGAIFVVGLARVNDVSELPGERVALVAGDGEPLWQVGDARPLTLLVGAEREGLPEQVVGACDRVAHIPIASESLNAAMAATVALYEMTRGGRDNDDRVPGS